MYAQFTEQFEESVKPMTELMKVNVATAESLARQNTALFTTMLNNGMSFTQSLMAEKDVAGLMSIQKEYGEDLQGKIVEASKEAYATIAEAQDKAGEIFKGAFTSVQAKAAEAAPKPAPKKTAK